MVIEKDYGDLDSRTSAYRDYTNARDNAKRSNFFQYQKLELPMGGMIQKWQQWKNSLWEANPRLRYLRHAFPIGPNQTSDKMVKRTIRMYAHHRSKIQYRFIFFAVNAWFIAKYVWPIANVSERFDKAVEYRWKRHNQFIGSGDLHVYVIGIVNLLIFRVSRVLQCQTALLVVGPTRDGGRRVPPSDATQIIDMQLASPTKRS